MISIVLKITQVGEGWYHIDMTYHQAGRSAPISPESDNHRQHTDLQWAGTITNHRAKSGTRSSYPSRSPGFSMGGLFFSFFLLFRGATPFSRPENCNNYPDSLGLVRFELAAFICRARYRCGSFLSFVHPNEVTPFWGKPGFRWP
jgi:hypothetical protein